MGAKGGYRGQRHLAVAVGRSIANHPAPRFVLALIMSADPTITVDPSLYPDGASAAAGVPGMSWSAIIAGSVAAIALTLTLLTLGSAFGLASISPWPGVGAKITTFSIGTGIWLIVTQWLSAAAAGYLAGRLRVRWHGLHTDETFFRDTAHGLLAWATATVIMAMISVIAISLSSIAATPAAVSTTPEAIDTARKAAATFAGFAGLSLVIGAFVGSVSGVIGGRLRDLHP